MAAVSYIQRHVSINSDFVELCINEIVQQNEKILHLSRTHVLNVALRQLKLLHSSNPLNYFLTTRRSAEVCVWATMEGGGLILQRFHDRI